MAASEDIEDAFDEAAEASGGTVKVGDRPPCLCLLNDGVVKRSEEVRGHTRSEDYAIVLVRRSAMGSLPHPTEQVALTYKGREYHMAVTEDDIEETGGAIIEFSIAG